MLHLLLLLALLQGGVTVAGRHAYAVVVTSTGYVDPARVLGQRLRSLDSIHDRIFITVDGVLDRAMAVQLAREGWVVRLAPRLHNPYASGPSDIKGNRVFSKLNIWNPNCTRGYDRLLFMDVDVLPIANPAALFDCTGVACVSWSTEWNGGKALNTGVLVVEPGEAVAEQLHRATRLIKSSYNRGDQGFLNTFLPEWCLAPEKNSAKDCDTEPNYHSAYMWASGWPSWQPGSSAPSASLLCPERLCQHFPPSYNFNVFKATGAELTKRPSPPRLLHFNYIVWAFKPWKWAGLPFFPAFRVWQDARAEAALSSPTLSRVIFHGTLGVVALAPWSALLFALWRHRREARNSALVQLSPLRALVVLGLTHAFFMLVLPAPTPPPLAWGALYATSLALLPLLAAKGEPPASKPPPSQQRYRRHRRRSRQYPCSCSLSRPILPTHATLLRLAGEAAIWVVSVAAATWTPVETVVLCYRLGILQHQLQDSATAGVVPAPAVLWPPHNGARSPLMVAWVVWLLACTAGFYTARRALLNRCGLCPRRWLGALDVRGGRGKDELV